jgi:hypothetical protein
MFNALMNATMLVGLWMGAVADLPASAPAHAARARAAAGNAPWKVLAAGGRVETRLTQAAPWRQARRGDRVAPLSRLRTLERARATLTRNGDLILVDAASEILVPETAPGEGTRVMQWSGNAIYKVAPRRPGERFEVRTPWLVAGVKGTRFSVQIRDEAAAVSVLEGVVEVTSALTGESRDLHAGEWIVVDARDNRMSMHEIAPPAPEVAPRPVDSEVIREEDILETSIRLDNSLEKDTALLSDSSLDLWSDLSDETRTVTGTVDGTLDRTITRLDPATSDTKTDPTLLDLLPLRKQP